MASKTFLQLYTDGLQLADETSGNGSALAGTIIKAGINESYSEIASIRDWKTLENNATISIVSGTEEYTPVTSSGTTCRIRRIESIKDETNDKFIQEVRREDFEQQYPYVSSTETGQPTMWYVSGYDSNRDPKVKFYPIPNGTATYRITFYEEPLELTSDQQEPRIPDQFQYGLVYLGLAKYFEYQKDPMATYYRTLHDQYKSKILSGEWGMSDEMPQVMPQTSKRSIVTGKLGRIYNT